MTVELWHATLNSSGPNYERLKEIFGEGRVPLKSSQSNKAQLGEEKDVPVYMLDLKALPLNARARLVAMVAKKCDATIAQVEEVMNTQGFPIREADVIVSFDMRAFV
jgi:hypothetical protein